METSLDQTSKPAGSQTDTTVGSGLATDLKQQAGEITEQAKAKAREAAHSGQSAAADQLEHLAQGVRRSAENFDDEQAWVKQGLSTAAESLERFSSTLRDRDLGDLMSEAEGVARRHPVVFAAACAFAGFALVRFLKSSGRHDEAYSGAGIGEYGSRARYGSMSGMERASTERMGERQAGDYASNI
jgi:hypothetical protein